MFKSAWVSNLITITLSLTQMHAMDYMDVDDPMEVAATHMPRQQQVVLQPFAPADQIPAPAVDNQRHPADDRGVYIPHIRRRIQRFLPDRNPHREDHQPASRS